MSTKESPSIDPETLKLIESTKSIGRLQLIALNLKKSIGLKIRFASYTEDEIETLRKNILKALNESQTDVRAARDSKRRSIDKIDTLQGLKVKAKQMGVIGYSRYTQSNMEELRKLLLDKLSQKTSRRSVQKTPLNPIVAKIKAVKTLKGLKDMAKQMGISGYNKYTRATMEELREILLNPPDEGDDESSPSEGSISDSDDDSDDESGTGTDTESDTGTEAQKENVDPEDDDLFVMASDEQDVGKNFKYDISKMKCHQSPKVITTTPMADYIAFKPKTLTIRKYGGDIIAEAQEALNMKLLNKLGKGSIGTAWSVDVDGKPMVTKFTPFTEGFGEASFKWEVVITKRAGALGVGPVTLSGQIVNMAHESCGIMTTEHCRPLRSFIFNREEVKEVVRLLQTLHKNGICHRDIGTRNILRSGNRLVIMDYGLAFIYPKEVPRMMQLYDYANLVYDFSLQKTNEVVYLLEELSKIYTKKDLTTLKFLTDITGTDFMDATFKKLPSKVQKKMRYDKRDKENFFNMEFMALENFPDYMMETLGTTQADSRLNKAQGLANPLIYYLLSEKIKK